MWPCAFRKLIFCLPIIWIKCIIFLPRSRMALCLIKLRRPRRAGVWLSCTIRFLHPCFHLIAQGPMGIRWERTEVSPYRRPPCIRLCCCTLIGSLEFSLGVFQLITVLTWHWCVTAAANLSAVSSTVGRSSGARDGDGVAGGSVGASDLVVGMALTLVLTTAASERQSGHCTASPSDSACLKHRLWNMCPHSILGTEHLG